MAAVTTSEPYFLLATQLGSPIGAAREEATRQLGALIAEGDEVAVKVLRQWIETRCFESQSAQGLLPFIWALFLKGGDISGSREVVEAIKYPSPLSDEYIRILEPEYERKDWASIGVRSHEGATPERFKYVLRHSPPPIRRIPSMIGDFPFEQYWRYGFHEVDCRANVPSLDALDRMGRPSRFHMIYEPRVAEVLYSGLQRATASLFASRGYSAAIARHASVVCPTLWIPPLAREPEQWRELFPATSPDLNDAQVDAYLDEAWLRTSLADMPIAYANARLGESETALLDIEVRGIYQKSIDGTSVDADDVESFLDAVSGVGSPWCAREWVTDFERTDIHDWHVRGWYVRPLSVAIQPAVFGRWLGHSLQRGIEIPLLNDRVVSQPNYGQRRLRFLSVEGDDIGLWQSWHHNYEIKATQGIPASTGQCTFIRRPWLEAGCSNPRARYAWLVKILRATRADRYRDFSVSARTRLIGTSSLLID
jgi:hypothetical protein